MTYITTEEVKSYAKVDYKDLGYETESEYNTFLSGLINQVESIIENHCNVPSGFFQDGGVSITDETYDWDDRFIILRYRPIISVSSVKLNMAGYAQTPDWQTIDSKYYIVYKNEGMIKIIGKTPAIPEQSVKISYTAGYASTPQAIKNVCLMLAGNILHAILQRKISPVVRIDEFTVKFVVPDVFTDEMRRILAPFVCRSFSIG